MASAGGHWISSKYSDRRGFRPSESSIGALQGEARAQGYSIKRTDGLVGPRYQITSKHGANMSAKTVEGARRLMRSTRNGIVDIVRGPAGWDAVEKFTGKLIGQWRTKAGAVEQANNYLKERNQRSR